jgi:hypothetical protein
VDVVDIGRASHCECRLLSWCEIFFIVVNFFNFFSKSNDFLKIKLSKYGKHQKNIENLPDFYTWVQVGSHKQKDVRNFSFHSF